MTSLLFSVITLVLNVFYPNVFLYANALTGLWLVPSKSSHFLVSEMLHLKIFSIWPFDKINFKGAACNVPACPQNCEPEGIRKGRCNKVKKRCDCFDGWTGEDCSQVRSTVASAVRSAVRSAVASAVGSAVMSAVHSTWKLGKSKEKVPGPVIGTV